MIALYLATLINPAFSLIMIFSMGVLSLIANLWEDLRRGVQYFAAFLLILSGGLIILLGLGIYSMIIDVIVLKLAVIVSLMAIGTLLATTYDYEKNLEAQIKGKHIFVGKVIKGYAGALAILWFFFKLGIMRWLPDLFETVDSILMWAFVLYIIGSGIEGIDTASAISAVRGFFGSVAFASLGVTILSFLLLLLHAVGAEWHAYHGSFVNFTIASIVITLVIYLVIPSALGERIRLGRISANKVTPLIFLRNMETNLDGRINLEISKDSIALAFSHRGLRGIYVQGDIRYDAQMDIKRLSGTANEFLAISRRGDEDIESIMEEAEEIDKRDIEYLNLDVEGMVDSLNNLLNQYGKEIVERSIIDAPMIKITEEEDSDFVKVGPLTVYDSPRGSYVKFGPFKIVEGDVSEFSRMRKLILLNDINRGIIRIKVAGNIVSAKTPREEIKLTSRRKIIKTDGKKVIIGRRKTVLRINGTVLILEKNKRAIIKKPDRKIIADAEKGTIIIKTRDKKKVINDKEQALATVKRVKQTIDKVLEATRKEPEIGEVKDLIFYLDRIVGRSEE